MSSTPFILSHHPPEAYNRCLSVAGLHLCARCTGVYPVLFGLLAVQLALRAPLTHPWDTWIAWVLPIPAVFDWARGRFNPASGTNLVRLVTGVMLGVALGRTLYLHLRQPLHPLAMKQLFAIAVVAAVVELLARPYRLRAAEDPFSTPSVDSGQESGAAGAGKLESTVHDQDLDGAARH